MTEKRGVSLGLVGLSFFCFPPLGLFLAWRHPAFQKDGKHDRLIVLAVILYIAIFVGSIALSFFEE